MRYACQTQHLAIPFVSLLMSKVSRLRDTTFVVCFYRPGYPSTAGLVTFTCMPWIGAGRLHSEGRWFSSIRVHFLLYMLARWGCCRPEEGWDRGENRSEAESVDKTEMEKRFPQKTSTSRYSCPSPNDTRQTPCTTCAPPSSLLPPPSTRAQLRTLHYIADDGNSIPPSHPRLPPPGLSWVPGSRTASPHTYLSSHLYRPSSREMGNIRPAAGGAGAEGSRGGRGMAVLGVFVWGGGEEGGRVGWGGDCDRDVVRMWCG